MRKEINKRSQNDEIQMRHRDEIQETKVKEMMRQRNEIQ